MKRRLLSLAASLSLSIGAGPPAAAAPPDATIPTAHLAVPLSVDCSALPSGQLAVALLRRYAVCGIGQAPSGSGTLRNNVSAQTSVSPQSSVSGNCGSVSLTLANAGGGYLQWRAEITSTMGPFVFASYSGSWHNMSRRTTGTVNRNFLGFSSDWVDRFRPYTRSGWVYGRITNAGLTTFWGLVCTSAFTVEDEAFVSGG
ncbi:MAG TPA: hypothetical protein VF013_07375 [Candidatus Limnocylindria bacterium]